MDEDIDSNEGVGGQEGDNDSPYGNNDDIDDPWRTLINSEIKEAWFPA